MNLKNYQFNTILREYDNRRFQNRYDAEQRKEELYTKFPILQEIDHKIIEGSIKSAKLSLLGDNTLLTGLTEANEKLARQKKQLIAEAGYPPNYLEEHYQCTACQDTGFIGSEKCHCFKQAIVDLVYSQSNVKEIIKNENFAFFSFSYYPNDYTEETTGLSPLSNIKKVVLTVKNFIINFDTTFKNLLFYGNTGVGKTFLTHCIAKELLDTAHTVIYLTAFELFHILEKYKFNHNEEEKDSQIKFEYILDCDLLIIDDLGTELNNSFITSQLYLCINERHLNQKSTIISTNLSFEQLKNNYSERIFSRVTSNYTLLKIIGEDIRLLKQLQ